MVDQPLRYTLRHDDNVSSRCPFDRQRGVVGWFRCRCKCHFIRLTGGTRLLESQQSNLPKVHKDPERREGTLQLRDQAGAAQIRV